MWYHAFVALAAFLITLLGTRLVILQLRGKPMLAEFSRETKSLSFPAPRGGGVAIVVALSAYLIATDASYSLVLGMVVLGGITFLSEWVAVPALVRMLMQLFVVAVIISMEHISLDVAWLDPEMDMLVMLLGWVWFINLYEAMDGIDGLATSEATCVSIGICFVLAMTEQISHPLFIHSLIIAAASSGFLWWNWPPAKILLGRTGNMAFGVVIGYALFSLAGMGYGISALILASYFLMESLFTNIKPLFKDLGDEHYYQLAARTNTPQSAIVRHVFGANIMLIGLAVFAALYPERAIYTLLAAILMVGILLLFFERLYHRRDVHDKKA